MSSLSDIMNRIQNAREEASSKAEAERLFNSGEHYEQGYDPVEEGMENVKIDMIEEVK